MANIVLVHGAFSDGSTWGPVITALRGHRVLGVQLPLTSLTADIAWTRRAIEEFDEPVTLVGHSYGGSVISGAAVDNARVSRLVFVAAFAPDTGESVASLTDGGAATPGMAAIQRAADGWATVDPDRFGPGLAADAPTATQHILSAVQKRTHPDCFTTPSGRPAWHDLPCSYLLCTEDLMLDPALQRHFAERTESTLTELRASHFPHFAHAEVVASAITSAAS
ncbi:alpha/beta fold hydrolase [Nocardia panacis]|uniref:alpha/beta fold hydrolase n=1 Tax=Nocardia panacis TaxID=2340916 RepID=UPI0013152270|nr:alpha/beta hydrolase [Nocardia panacis]